MTENETVFKRHYLVSSNWPFQFQQCSAVSKEKQFYQLHVIATPLREQQQFVGRLRRFAGVKLEADGPLAGNSGHTVL